MNKKANRRAFFVCILVCLMYLSVAAKLPERVSFKRIFHYQQRETPASMAIYTEKKRDRAMPETWPEKAPKEVVKTGQKVVRTSQGDASGHAPDEAHMEPSLFMSVPLVCLAIKAKLLEKDGLISAGKSSHNIASWKKPVDILNDRDEEGLRNISKTIDVKQLLFLLKGEGITLQKGLTAEEIVVGKGYFVEKKKLLSFYNNAVTAEYDRLLPFVLHGTGIVRRNGSFEFIAMKDDIKRQSVKEAPEWQMPNLMNLPMRVALERLGARTAKVRVYGSGIVSEQSPKPFERTTDETECVIYGRTR
jgi:hypothetical protein